MSKLTFVQFKADDANMCETFENLMRIYSKELDEHQNRIMPELFITKWIHSIIQIQGDYDRHLELCYAGETLIGFLYGKIDHPEHRGFKKIGYGYIMEFFVLPEHRRKGYGKEMFHRLETLFKQDGATKMYLSADPITGRPFWEALGFARTNEKSPENNQVIYEKEIK